MSDDLVIVWDKAMLKRFKRANAAALKRGGQYAVFKFHGHRFLASYGRYLIKFLEETL